MARKVLRARAKMLAHYLENELGWEVRDTQTRCPQCPSVDYGGAPFCKQCGAKMVAVPDKNAIGQLMDALKYSDKKE